MNADRQIWMPGGKGGGGRYVKLSDLILGPPEPDKPVYVAYSPANDPFWAAAILVGCVILGVTMATFLLWASGNLK